MRPRPSEAVSGSLAGVLAAGQRLQAALDAEHALSAGLESRPGESGLYDRFREARECTRLASCAYDEAIRNCADGPAGRIGPERPTAGVWARIAAMALRPGSSKASSSLAAAASRH